MSLRQLDKKTAYRQCFTDDACVYSLLKGGELKTALAYDIKLKEFRKSNKMRQALECQIHDSDLQEALEKANNINKKGKDLQMKEGSAKEEQDSLNLELQGLTMGKTKLKLSLIDLQTR